MLAAALALGIGGFALEMAVGAHFAPLRHLAARSALANLVISIAFTWVLSALFGASGVTLMTASMIGTILSLITYRLIGAAKYVQQNRPRLRGRSYFPRRD